MLNETLVNYFGRRTNGNKGPIQGMISVIQCQYCKLEKHITSTSPKLTYLRPRCAKCGGGHNINNCNLKCYFCLGMGHTKDRCWKKNGKGPSACANFLKKLVNDEEATLIKLNQLFGIKHNVFSKIKMPKHKMHVQASTS